MKIAVLPGDGIGPEIVAQAAKIFDALRGDGLKIELEYAHIGGAGYDAAGDPLPDSTLKLARESDAVLLGAVGGYQYDTLPRDRCAPSRGCCAYARDWACSPTCARRWCIPSWSSASTLKPELVSGLDIMILRELTGDIYFGQPRGIRTLDNGEKRGFRHHALQRVGDTPGGSCRISDRDETCRQ